MAGAIGESVLRYPPFTNANEPSLPDSYVPGIIDVAALRSIDGVLGRAGLSKKVLRYIVRTAAVVLTVSIALDIITHHGSKLFTLHPVLITLGFTGLMSEGVLLGTAFRALDGPERVQAITRHALIQVAAYAAIIAGFWAIFQNKINLGKQHFISWHGRLGVALTAAAFLVLVGGAVSFRRIGILAKLPAHVQPLVKAIHTYSGPAVWLFAMFEMLLGLQTHGAGPRVLLHWLDAVGIIMMTAAQGLLLLPSESTSVNGLTDAAAAGESDVLMTELHHGHPEEARARLHADDVPEQ